MLQIHSRKRHDYGQLEQFPEIQDALELPEDDFLSEIRQDRTSVLRGIGVSPWALEG